MILVCKLCKCSFASNKSNRIYCSKKCHIVDQKGKPLHKKGKYIICKKCKVSFYIHKCESSKQFCSRSCYLFYRYGTAKPHCICKTCGKKISKKLWNKKYCSMPCRNADPEFHLWKKGELHHNWKGGITTENEKARKGNKYKEWQLTIFKRDNYTCQECKKKGGVLHAHHIKSFSGFPLLRYDINNGKTLCFSCHALLHPNLRLVDLGYHEMSKRRTSKIQKQMFV